jgi:hypothetical protein
MNKKQLEPLLSLFDVSEFVTPPATASPESQEMTSTPTPEDCESLDKTLAMMLAVMDLEIGMGMSIFAPLLAMDGQLSLEQYRYLLGPFILPKDSGWNELAKAESMAWIYRAIHKERLEIVVNELKHPDPSPYRRPLASAAEIVLMMYPTTHDAPLQSRWADLYLYACSLVLPRHKFPDGLPENPATGQPYESWWEFVGVPGYERLTYDRVQQEYEDLAQDIRRKVVQGAQRQGISLPRKSAQAEPEPSNADQEATTLHLF